MTQLKPLSEQTIVITGASSGIGLATAKAAARAGAQVVLAARNEGALSDIVEGLSAEGATVTYQATDVGDRAQMEALAEFAIRRFGGFDTWVNDAGVDIWGRIEEISEDDSRRLFETNFWGVVHGSTIAAAHLKEKGGAIINVGSVASDRAFPLQGIYSASKHAVKGFTDALRVELEAEGAPVSVTLIKPSSIGSPLSQQAKNYMEKEPILPAPVYAPEEVAHAILHAAVKPVRDIYVGAAGRLLAWLGMQFPNVSDRLGSSVLIGSQKRKVAARDRKDNLHQAGPGGGMVQSDPEGRTPRMSFSTRFELDPWPKLVAGALAAVVAGVLVSRAAARAKAPWWERIV